MQQLTNVESRQYMIKIQDRRHLVAFDDSMILRYARTHETLNFDIVSDNLVMRLTPGKWKSREIRGDPLTDASLFVSYDEVNEIEFLEVRLARRKFDRYIGNVSIFEMHASRDQVTGPRRVSRHFARHFKRQFAVAPCSSRILTRTMWVSVQTSAGNIGSCNEHLIRDINRPARVYMNVLSVDIRDRCTSRVKNHGVVTNANSNTFVASLNSSRANLARG